MTDAIQRNDRRCRRRLTADRAAKAGLVVVNSVFFRSTGARPDRTRTWIEIISRIGESVLLGFAARGTGQF